MPRFRDDWESEYKDPISDAEDAKLAEEERRQNEEIMLDILQCEMDIENREFADMVYEDNRRQLEDDILYDLEEEDYHYWQEMGGW